MAATRFVPQYVPKEYIPTDIGFLSNIVGQAQQQYDTARGLRDAAIESLYGLETSTAFAPEKERLISGLESTIEEAVARHGGDYGAALKDISKIIARTGRDPFFQLNKIQQEQSKMLEQQLMRNPNLLVLNDPRIQQYNPYLTEEDLRYNIVDPAQIDAAFMDLYGARANQIREQLPTYNAAIGRDVATTIKGLTSREAMELAASEEAFYNVISRVPQLQGYLDNPEIANAIRQRISAQAQGLVRGQQHQYLNPIRGQEQVGGTGSLGTPFNIPESVRTRIDNKARQTRESLKNITGPDGNLLPASTIETLLTEEEMDRMRQGTKNPRYHMDKLSKLSKLYDERRAYHKFETLKSNYPALYQQIQQAKGTDSDFYNMALDLETNQAYVSENILRIDNPKFSDNLPRLGRDMSELFVNDRGKKVSYADFNKQFKDTGLRPGDLSSFVTAKGDIVTQDPNGKIYKINKNIMSNAGQIASKSLSKMYENFFNYKHLTPDDVSSINNDIHVLPNTGYGWSVYINPDNITQRVVLLNQYDRNAQQWVPVQQSDNFMEYQQQMLSIIEQDLMNAIGK